MCEILFKLFATRLKRIIRDVVEPYWSAFVDRRQILDAAMFANELVDSQFNTKKKVVICKLDAEKTFDYALWDCLCMFQRRWGLERGGAIG